MSTTFPPQPSGRHGWATAGAWSTLRAVAFDNSLPPTEALGRIGDAFQDYDQQGCIKGPLSHRQTAPGPVRRGAVSCPPRAAQGHPLASAERPTPPRAARWSAFEYRDDRRAEVVGPACRSLHDAEELEELVVGRVGRRAAMVDQDLEPNLAGVPGDGLAVRAVRDGVSGRQDEERQRAVAVVGHAEILVENVLDLGDRVAVGHVRVRRW